MTWQNHRSFSSSGRQRKLSVKSVLPPKAGAALRHLWWVEGVLGSSLRTPAHPLSSEMKWDGHTEPYRELSPCASLKMPMCPSTHLTSWPFLLPSKLNSIFITFCFTCLTFQAGILYSILNLTPPPQTAVISVPAGAKTAAHQHPHSSSPREKPPY